MGNLLYQKRSHPSNPDNWLLYAMSGGRTSYTGKTVTEDESLSLTSVWSAVQQLAQGVSTLPLHLYERISTGGKKKSPTHPLYTLLHQRPNPEMSSVEFRDAMAGQCVLWGNSYANVERNGAGKIVNLWPLLSSHMTMKRSEVNRGQLFYLYRNSDGSTSILLPHEVLRFTGFTTQGVIGQNPIAKGMQAVGLGLALEEYSARFFGQGAMPPAVLEHPGTIGEAAMDNLRKSWQMIHGGLENVHRTAILEEGMTLKQYGVNPENAQMLESRRFSVSEISRIFNIPPHMLKDLERSTYNNIEQMSTEFVIYSLRPWLVRFEQSYNTQLLTLEEQQVYFAEHVVDGLLRGDLASRYEAYMKGVQNGWLSPNDVREMENMNPIKNGGTYYIPMNMVPIGSMVPPKQEEMEEEEEMEDEEMEDEE